MNTGFPDPETVRTALALASRAPSVHNTQPWRWRIDPAGLHLYADPARQLPHTDPDGRDLILSCGIALQHCVTAFAAVGWRSRVCRLPDPDDPDHLATLEFFAPDRRLRRRRARRRDPAPAHRPAPLQLLAGAGRRHRADGGPGGPRRVTLYQVQDVCGLHDIVAQSIRDHLTQDYLAELTTWSGRYFSVSGVPARNTPFPDPDAKIPTRLFAGAALPMAPGSSAADDNAVVLALGTRHDDRLARLRAGEATGVVLLTATSAGLASCPVTEPLETPQTRAAVRADIFGDGHHPQMLLRVGWAPINADPLPATPRRDLADFVEWVG